MFTVYILYSKLRDRFYVGFTGNDIAERLRKHNANHKGFTGRIADWQIIYTEPYASKSEAMRRESAIKKWKSRQMIEKLIG